MCWRDVRRLGVIATAAIEHKISEQIKNKQKMIPRVNNRKKFNNKTEYTTNKNFLVHKVSSLPGRKDRAYLFLLTMVRRTFPMQCETVSFHQQRIGTGRYECP